MTNTNWGTILVTGCAGFIGSNFVSHIRTYYPETVIVGVDNFFTGKRERVHSDIVFYEGSICDKEFMKVIFSTHAPQYVFHFAAIPQVSYSVDNPAETTQVNLFGTVHLLELSRDHKVRRFFFPSSAAVYGDVSTFPIHELTHIPNPMTPYGLHKHAGEGFCRVFSMLYNLDTVCFRFFNVFGPGQYGDSPYSSVIASWLENIYFPDVRKKPFLEGDGTQSRDFCYVGDIIRAHVRAMEFEGVFQGEVFNISASTRTDLNTIRELIEKHTGRTVDLERRPPRPGDIKHSHADITKAQKYFGFDPQVSFEDGLKHTILWFDERTQTSH